MTVSSRSWLALSVVVLGACRANSASGPDASSLPVTPAPSSARERYERADAHAHVDPRLYPLAFQILQKVGVGRLVNLSGGPPGPSLAAMLEMAKPYGHRVLTCTNPDWDHVLNPDFGARMAADLERAVAMGAACLKIPKALGLGVPVPGEGLLRVDDDRLAPLWDAAGRLGVPVYIHVGDPAAFWRPATPDNERFDELHVHPGWSYAGKNVPPRAELLAQFERLLGRHRGTTFVGVHFGNDPEDVDATDARMDAHPNLWVDTAARVPEIGRARPERLRAFFIKHQDRVMFGTDLGVTAEGIMLGTTDGTEPQWADVLRFFDLHWRFFEGAEQRMPHPSPIQGRWTVDAIQLPAAVLRKFYLHNAERLLKWPALAPMAPGTLDWPPGKATTNTGAGNGP